jgi:hypothetical protein
MEVPDEMLAAKDALAAALSAALPFLPGVQGVDVGLRRSTRSSKVFCASSSDRCATASGSSC